MLCSGKVSMGDDKWYEYHDKVDELVKQRDAYNRGMMGQLDGEKAQAAEEQVTAGGGRRISLDANDGAVYTGRPGVEDYKDESQNAEKQDDYSGLTAEELNNKKQEETNNFVEENNAKREVDKQFLKEDIISRNMTMYNEAMTAAKFGDYKLLNNLKTFVYNGEPVGYVPSEQLKEDLIAYALEAEDYDQLCKDIDSQYDKAEADGIQAMDDEFDPYFERLAVTDQLGDDYTVMDWTNDSVDLSIDNSSEISGINTQVQELKNYALDLEVMDNPDKYKEIYSISADIKDLENRKKEWEQYNEKYEIAKTADLEELDALQLFMRAGYDTQAIINETNSEIEKIIPMLKQAEQGALYEGLVYFNDALKEFEEGDDARIESIFTETYGDEGKPFDTENLDIDELRDAYLKHNWDSSGLEEEFIQPLIDARDEKLAEYRETMRPYLEEQMNYEETKSGFNLEISPEMIEYTIAYAEGKEKGYTSDSNVTSASGIAGGALTAVISATGVGIAVGVVIGMISLIASDTLNDKADQWDDLANELEHYMDTDKPLKIQVIGDKVFVDKIDEEN